jgi:hypothetical protein
MYIYIYIYIHTYSYTYTYIRTYHTCIAYMCTYNTYLYTRKIYIYIYMATYTRMLYTYKGLAVCYPINSVDLTKTLHFSSPNF